MRVLLVLLSRVIAVSTLKHPQQTFGEQLGVTGVSFNSAPSSSLLTNGVFAQASSALCPSSVISLSKRLPLSPASGFWPLPWHPKVSNFLPFFFELSLLKVAFCRANVVLCSLASDGAFVLGGLCAPALTGVSWNWL